jgi:hypothetical protein
VTTFPVRVTVLDAWEAVDLAVEPGTPVTELKRRALAAARIRGDPDDYVVKFRGAELGENGPSLAQAGVGPNAALIVLPRRRFPVR